MAMPEVLKKKYLARFDELIAEGTRVVEGLPRNSKYFPDGRQSVEWGTKCASLLMIILPRNHPRRAMIPELGVQAGCAVNPPYQLAQLKGIRDDFINGFLDNLSEQIEAEIAADYMGQAEKLLDNGQSGKFDHVPAAVLSGAVLENCLRTLCRRQSPPIPVLKSDGEPLTLNPIIIALKKADVIKKTEWSQLETWAHIRNKAAHGEFNEFTRAEVARMLGGIKDFLARHL